MAKYASNTPISRPVDTGHTPDSDLGGLQWNNDVGFIYAPEGELLPFRLPTKAQWNPPPVLGEGV